MIEPNIVHLAKCPFHDIERNVYTVDNFLDEDTFSLIKDYVFSFSEFSLTSQNFDTKTITEESGDQRKLMGYYRNRPFRKIWHLGHYPGYWKQSKHTIYDFAFKTAIPEMVHPLIFKYFQKIKEVSVLQDDWIPTRTIINLLNNGRTLDGHCDSNLNETDLINYAPTVSATLYINLPTRGGNLWFADGFIWTPKVNSLAIFEGSRVFHGVSAVDDDDPNFTRYALTTRFVRARDLLFPADAPMFYPPDEKIFEVS